MSWDDIAKIILGIIASVGGIGTIVCFVVKFASEIIADKLSKKYELQMTKAIELYRDKLDKKNYISKARFDKEFEIYQKLSEKALDMTFANYVLFPVHDSVPPTEEEQKVFFNDRYTKAVQTYNDANRTIKASAPFIPENIYRLFSELRDDCCKQIDDFAVFFLEPDYQDNRRELKDDYKECKRRTRVITEKRDEIIGELRHYLFTLDVLD